MGCALVSGRHWKLPGWGLATLAVGVVVLVGASVPAGIAIIALAVVIAGAEVGH